MKAREYIGTDYETLCEWWRGHGWGGVAVPEACIPADTIIVEDETGRPAACVMIYVYTGVPMARIGFIVNNPELDQRIRSMAMRTLAREVVRRLASLGVIHAQAFYPQHSLQRLFTEAGFVRTRSEVAELTWSPNMEAVTGVLNQGEL